MTDAQKPVPPSNQPQQPQPPRPPQAPPLKVAAGASGPRPPIAPLPNPTLPRPTPPNQGATLPTPASAGNNFNTAKMGTPPPAPRSLPSIQPPAPMTSSMPTGARPPAPGTSTITNAMPAGSVPPRSAMPPLSPIGKPAAINPPPTTPPPTGKPPGQPAAKPMQPAEIRKSPFRFLPFILGGLLLIGIIGFIIMKLLTGGISPTGTTTSKDQVSLTYWGLWEPSAVLTQVINDYQTAHPNVKIVYQQQSYRDYHDRLQTAISQNKGPDIFRFHASWVPMIRQELAPMPSTVYSDTEYQNTFYPIATKQLKLNGSYVGIPLEYDGLELYYNKDILNTANVQPPTTWAEMQRIAKQLTITDSNGNIKRAGLAIGNASNVDHFSDILGLLLLQNKADPTNVTSQAAIEAVSFYTSFVTKDKVWDSTLPNSTTAFGRGDVAMIFAPSWRAHDIKAAYPNLNFAVAPVPQLTDQKVAWASYWAEGVNAQSTHKTEAWEFLKYMSSATTMQKFYSDASKVRSFGEIYSRQDLAGSLANDPYVGAYVNDAPAAQNWYLNSETHDNGINDNVIKYFEDAINKSLSNSGQSMSAAMTTVQQGQAQILNQYGVSLNPGSQPATQTTTQ